jgi:hypothetical protein
MTAASSWEKNAESIFKPWHRVQRPWIAYKTQRRDLARIRVHLKTPQGDSGLCGVETRQWPSGGPHSPLPSVTLNESPVQRLVLCSAGDQPSPAFRAHLPPSHLPIKVSLKRVIRSYFSTVVASAHGGGGFPAFMSQTSAISLWEYKWESNLCSILRSEKKNTQISRDPRSKSCNFPMKTQITLNRAVIASG